MIWTTPEPAALADASAQLGLEYAPGRREFRYRQLTSVRLPDWLALGDRNGQGGAVLLADHALLAPPPRRRARRPPNDVGVFRAPPGRSDVCVADLEYGGFGLDAFVGPDGGRLRYAYAVAAAALALERLELPADRRVTPAGDFLFVTSCLEGSVSRRLSVRVATSGAVSVEVNGVVGPGCQALLDGLTRAAGAEVTSAEAKPELHQTADQAVAQPEDG